MTGVLPGPSLWRVTQGDRTLWLLGTVSPLPRDMVWDAEEIDALVASADQVIAPGGAMAKVGPGDALKIATLARSAHAATRNPDGKRLKAVLPAATYEIWKALRVRYMPADRGVERSRPMFASQDLYFSAIQAAGMTRHDIVWARVKEAALAHQVPITQTGIQFPLAIDRSRYKDGIRALASSQVDDVTCFERTLDTLASDLERMKRGANAWATGDLGLLQELRIEELIPACKPVYDAAMGFQARPEIKTQAADAWLAAAESALQRYQDTVAVLPMREIVASDGLVSRLRANGHKVIAPPGLAVE